MGFKVNNATYQGYPVLALGMTFSDGTRPDIGFVDLNIRDFKEVKINSPGIIPWIPGGVAGQISIEAFDELLGRTTETGDVPRLPNPESGISRAGDLFIETEDIDTGKTTGTTWRNIYVSPGGMEEITPDLKFAFKHEVGTWRIHLTDPRWWWKWGALASSINMRLDGGKLDPDTVKDEGDEVWNTSTVFRYVMSQMAGTPRIDNDSQFFKLDLRTPEDVPGELRPAVQVFEKLLRRYALTVEPTPEGFWAINQRWVTVERGEYFISANKTRQAPDGTKVQFLDVSNDLPNQADLPRATPSNIEGPFTGQAYEKKSATITGKPPMVMVKGQRRIRSIEVAYSPIFQDTDGRFYLLEDLPKRWIGYTLEDAREQVLLPPERAFQNVPPGALPKDAVQKILPRAFPRGTGQLYHQRREIAQKWFFRGYGPTHAFVETLPDGTSRTRSLSRQELTKMPFLPIQNFAELRDEADVPDKFEIVAPQVRGYRIRQGFYTGRETFKPGATFVPPATTVTGAAGAAVAAAGAAVPVAPPTRRRAWDEIRTSIEFHIKEMKSDVKEKQRAFDETLRTQREAVDDLLAIDLWIEQNKDDVAKILGEEPDTLIELKLDGSKQATSFLGTVQVVFRAQDEARFNRAYENLAKITQQLVQDEKAILEAQKKEQETIKQAENAFLNQQGLGGWINDPHKMIPEGHYTLDRESGIMLFDDIVGVMQIPFVIAREQTVLQTHGHVLVRYGYELRTNSAHEWSSVLFVNGGKGKLKVVGMCRPSPLKCPIEEDPMLRIYEDSEGLAINGEFVIRQASKRAGAVLEPTVVDGYIYELSGFHRAVPIAGQVQYTFDGDVARTFIAINAPAGTLKLGSQFIKAPTIIEDIRIREYIE